MSFKNLFRYIAVLTFIFSSIILASAQTATAYLTEPAFSPDRKEIVFVSGGDIWTVPASGGTASLLVSHPATESRPQFSPDGKKLAFISNRTGSGDIYVLDFATNDVKRITFDDATDNFDAWSPDGKWLYFFSNSKDIAGMNDIFRVSANGGTPQEISSDRYTNEFFAAPAPDGNSLAFSARGIANGQWWRNGRSHIDESEIWMKRGENYEKISDGGAKQLWTMWSADGSRMFYVSDRSGTQNIWSQPVKGQPKQLTNFKSGRVLWANISYDGRQIVFERDFKIWTLDTNGGNAKEVAITLRGLPSGNSNERKNFGTQVSEFSLSPDGKKIAVVAHGEVFAASSKDGGEALRVTETAAAESFAVWSPDSKTVVYISERNGKLQIFGYDFSNETETQLTTNGDDYSPVFSPDGKYFAFVRNGRSLWIYDVNAKKERELSKLFTDTPPLVGKQTLAWSPDSNWVAFLNSNPETRSYTNVSVASINGGEAKSLSFLANSNSGSISWSPDGAFILFDTNQRTEDGSLARIDLQLRTPKFREDQFRDLFKQENPQQKPQPSPQISPTPAVSPSPSVSPTATPTPTPASKKDEKKTEIVFENIRRRLSIIPTGISTFGQAISPDGKTVLLLASSEGQFNLYTMPLDELATDQSAKQITSTPAFKGDAQFSPDSKEVYYLEKERVNIVN
ncbi:MAG: S41 family peptidase, partial [Pyrinomonadaceae bacterium]